MPPTAGLTTPLKLPSPSKRMWFTPPPPVKFSISEATIRFLKTSKYSFKLKESEKSKSNTSSEVLAMTTFVEKSSGISYSSPASANKSLTRLNSTTRTYKSSEKFDKSSVSNASGSATPPTSMSGVSRIIEAPRPSDPCRTYRSPPDKPASNCSPGVLGLISMTSPTKKSVSEEKTLLNMSEVLSPVCFLN